MTETNGKREPGKSVRVALYNVDDDDDDDDDI